MLAAPYQHLIEEEKPEMGLLKPFTHPTKFCALRSLLAVC